MRQRNHLGYCNDTIHWMTYAQLEEIFEHSPCRRPEGKLTIGSAEWVFRRKKIGIELLVNSQNCICYRRINFFLLRSALAGCWSRQNLVYSATINISKHGREAESAPVPAPRCARPRGTPASGPWRGDLPAGLERRNPVEVKVKGNRNVTTLGK